MNTSDLRNKLELLCEENKIDIIVVEEIAKLVESFLENDSELIRLKSKLELIFEYEKHYLNLVKEYKEEIKFINSVQEDLRKEKSQFFSQNLKEIMTTLKEQQVDSKVSSIWLEDLVNSYIKSLDISNELVQTNIKEDISNLREETKTQIDNVKSIKGKKGA